MRALTFTLALVLAGLQTAPAAALSLSVTSSPNPPDTGNNVIDVTVLDDAKKPVDTAKLTAVVSMPAMGTMPYMEEKTTITSKGNGKFSVKYNLPMGGTWEVKITPEVGGKSQVFQYSVTTGIEGIADMNTGAGTTTSEATNLLKLGPDRLQKIGVRFAEVKRQNLEKRIRAVGVVEQDQTHRTDLSLRYSGYVVKQIVGRVGDHVEKGKPLFSVYSPELVTAQSEFLLAHSGAGGPDRTLHESAAERLKNLGLSTSEIERIRKNGKPIRDVFVAAPQSGTILEVNVRDGAAFQQGQVLYVIGDLSKTYTVARVFQDDLSLIKAGQAVDIEIPGGERSQGRVDLVYPQVQEGAGTGNVRVESNTFMRGLRPGVYADLRFPVSLGSRLAIPAEAVLYTGTHKYVFVDRGGGALEPKEIQTGARAGELIEVTGGLTEGERVVASGTFLLSSEAQLRSALPKWETSKDGAP